MTKMVENLNPRDRIEHEGRRLIVREVHTLPNHAEVVANSVRTGEEERVAFPRHEQVEVFH